MQHFHEINEKQTLLYYITLYNTLSIFRVVFSELEPNLSITADLSLRDAVSFKTQFCQKL